MATSMSAAPPAPLAPLVGTTVGSYHILRVLGEGGMGTVYLAQHTLIGRKAALKVLNAECAADPEVVARFFNEACSVNQIRHPNIVEVTDFGRFGDLHFIVMECLEGETLAARLARVGKLPAASAVGIFRQVASALAAAHELGLVHRDIKPDNVFLSCHPDYPDFVKVLDFGIAKLTALAASAGTHTRTGAVLGTPRYMSPEQCLGEATLDHRSDIYSLGVVIYEALTGRAPFEADTLGRLVVAHVSEPPPPPRQLAPEVSPALEQVVLRCLAKRPADRFQSARDLRIALDGAATVPRQDASALPHPTAPAPASAVATSAPAAASNTVGLESTALLSRTALDAARGPTQDLPNLMAGVLRDRVRSGRLTVPPLPFSIGKLLPLLDNPKLDFARLAHTIAAGSATMGARLVRIANGPEFGGAAAVARPEQAMARLGVLGLRHLLLEMGARDLLEARQNVRVHERLPHLWTHSLGTAALAADLARSSGARSISDTVYEVGLLHDIGKPIIGALLLDIQAQIRRAARSADLPLAAWLAVVDQSAAGAAVLVARGWELPESICNALDANQLDAQDPRAASNFVLLAGAMVARMGLGGHANDAGDQDVLDRGPRLIGLGPNDLTRACEGLRERVLQMSRDRI